MKNKNNKWLTAALMPVVAVIGLIVAEIAKNKD